MSIAERRKSASCHTPDSRESSTCGISHSTRLSALKHSERRLYFASGHDQCGRTFGTGSQDVCGIQMPAPVLFTIPLARQNLTCARTVRESTISPIPASVLTH